MTFSFAVQTILILCVISGIIAFLGNRVGRFFGKKRLTLFGLRPRRTAAVFTVISGILVMLITFMTLVFISRDVRTAFFGLEKLRGAVKEAKAELNSQKKELNLMRVEKVNLQGLLEDLKEEISKQQSHTVVFTADQTVLVEKLQGGKGAEAAASDLEKTLLKLDTDIKKFNIQDVEVDKTDHESTLSYLANMEGEVVLTVVSSKNIVAGDKEMPIKLQISRNEIIYKKGDEILKSEISDKLSISEIEQKLKDLVSQAKALAYGRGLSFDITGSRDNVPYPEIYNTARRVKGYGTESKVKIVASKDIYAIGPFSMIFEVEI